MIKAICLCFYCELVNMCKKSNELKRKQQIRTQMSQYVSNKDLLRVVWNVKRIHDKLLFDDDLPTDFAENLLARK